MCRGLGTALRNPNFRPCVWRWRPWNGTGCSTWRSQNKASSTQRIYSTAARQLIDFLDSAGRLRAPEALTKRDIEAFMEHMTTTRSASTPPKGQDTANLLDPPVQRRAGHRAVDRPEQPPIAPGHRQRERRLADIDRDHDRRTHPDRLLRLTPHSTF